jgi:hypothetical protein
MYFTGTTVTLKATFKDEKLELKDPTEVKFQLLNALLEPITEELPMGDENKLSTGVYFYHHTIPEDYPTGFMYYEFKGIINGYPIEARKRLSVTKVKE